MFAMKKAVAALIIVAGAPLSGALAQPVRDYTSQNSATSYYHSGICTTSGIVWDTSFASMVGNAIGNNYNEIGFGFMQCFGGGMIDELKALNGGGLVPAAYVSAAQHNETSWAGGRDAASGGKRESYFNLHYSPAAGGTVANTLRTAYDTGRANDLTGPVVNMPQAGNPIEHPQYTSSGAIGDNITLHRNNPQNPVQNTKYRAVLFGGNEANIDNWNSLNRTRNDLIARGYANTEVYSVFCANQIPGGGGAVPGWVDKTNGSAKDLKAAWQWVADTTTPGTQIYYWNSYAHGDRMFDLVGFVRDTFSSVIQRLQNYSFSVDSDFLNQINQYRQTFGPSLGQPLFEVVSPQAMSGLSVTLNGTPLNLVASSDVFEDGSQIHYRFSLDGASFSLSDTFAINYSGSDVNLLMAGPSVSDFSSMTEAPTPGTAALLLLGSATLLRRRRA